MKTTSGRHEAAVRRSLPPVARPRAGTAGSAVEPSVLTTMPREEYSPPRTQKLYLARSCAAPRVDLTYGHRWRTIRQESAKVPAASFISAATTADGNEGDDH